MPLKGTIYYDPDWLNSYGIMYMEAFHHNALPPHRRQHLCKQLEWKISNLSYIINVFLSSNNSVAKSRANLTACKTSGFGPKLVTNRIKPH